MPIQHEELTPKQNAFIEAIELMAPEERKGIFSYFCMHCGSSDPDCDCMDPEISVKTLHMIDQAAKSLAEVKSGKPIDFDKLKKAGLLDDENGTDNSLKLVDEKGKPVKVEEDIGLFVDGDDPVDETSGRYGMLAKKLAFDLRFDRTGTAEVVDGEECFECENIEVPMLKTDTSSEEYGPIILCQKCINNLFKAHEEE